MFDACLAFASDPERNVVDNIVHYFVDLRGDFLALRVSQNR